MMVIKFKSKHIKVQPLPSLDQVYCIMLPEATHAKFMNSITALSISNLCNF